MDEPGDTILIVEGDESHAFIISRDLEKRNFRVLTAASAFQALEIIEKTPSDFLLFDLNAAGTDFLEFYSWLNESPQAQQIPRAFIADKPQANFASSLVEHHGEKVYFKPLNIDLTIEGLYNRQAELKTGKIHKETDYLSSLVGDEIGGVLIRKEIARSGMEAVFLGYQVAQNRQVAIKILLPGILNTLGSLDSLKNRLKAAALLKSPHITKIFDFSLHENHIFYIIMEYLEGESIVTCLDHSGKFSIAKAFSVVLQVARGLTVAHKAGLVHMAIKPSNLVMNSSGHVSITDFGLARQPAKINQPGSGMLLAPPHYLSPEQIIGSTPDCRSDIYALGIVFYEMLVGLPPFSAKNSIEISMNHMHTPLPDPRQTVPDIPREVVDILNRMAAKDPDSRYKNCAQLFEALEVLNRKYALSKDMRVTPNRGTFLPPETGMSMGIDSSFHRSFAIFNKYSPALLNPDRLLGTLVLNESGQLIEQKGQVPDQWKDSVFVLHESASTLNKIAEIGQWKFDTVSTSTETAVASPHASHISPMVNVSNKGNLGVMIFWTRQSTAPLPPQSPPCPVKELASHTGIIDVLLFDRDGRLLKHSLKTQLPLHQYVSHISPVTGVLNSLPPVKEMRIQFEKGRILIVKLNAGSLFLMASSDISTSSLSTVIASHRDPLNSCIQIATKQPLQ
ncbi:MAG: protein kinase [bacterium]|nr:protein kinase [bacterium]